MTAHEGSRDEEARLDAEAQRYEDRAHLIQAILNERDALRAQNARLRKALDAAVDCLEHGAPGQDTYTDRTLRLVRVALAEPPPSMTAPSQ